MRTIAFQRSLSVRGLKILVTIITASSLYCGSLATGQTTSSISVNGADDWKQVEAAMGRSGQIQPGDVVETEGHGKGIRTDSPCTFLTPIEFPKSKEITLFLKVNAALL